MATYKHLRQAHNRKAAAIVLRSYRTTQQAKRAMLRTLDPASDDYRLQLDLLNRCESQIYGARQMLAMIFDV